MGAAYGWFSRQKSCTMSIIEPAVLRHSDKCIKKSDSIFQDAIGSVKVWVHQKREEECREP